MNRMSRLLLACSALVLIGSAAGAADLGVQPVYKAVPAAAPLTYDWRGFYVGAHVGGVNTKVDSNTIDIATGISTGISSPTSSGIFGGGQICYNFTVTPTSPLDIDDAHRRGKGFALKFAFQTLLDAGVDAVFVVEAYSVIDSNMLPEVLEI
jgi:opacity protein-like surface antigen